MRSRYIGKEGRRSGNEKWVIGLLVEEAVSEYARDLIRDVADALPKDESVHLVVLAGKYDDRFSSDQELHEYNLVYNTVYGLSGRCDLDGLIVSVGSLSVDRESGGFAGNEDFLKIPRVYIGMGPEGETAITCDHEGGIRAAIDFLINVNGCQKICMLGGRNDNVDAMERKKVFKRCLSDYGIRFSENMYEETDMSEHCTREAERLLAHNPDMEAVFCVNDSTAKGLYGVLKSHGLEPGKDVKVFGFDNTRGAGGMEPPLASVGLDGTTAGGHALKVLMAKLEGGEEVNSVSPTRLYGRASLNYESYDYLGAALINADKDLICRMFDDCFYRMKNSNHDRENVDLRRLFYEFISRMLSAVRNRYMSPEEFGELIRLTDIFIDHGAIEYTDTQKMMKSILRLQTGINSTKGSIHVNTMINRVFLRFKDRLIEEFSEQIEREREKAALDLSNLQQFLMRTADRTGFSGDGAEKVVRNFKVLGFRDAALYLFEDPVIYENEHTVAETEKINLRCVVRDGDFYMIPEERRTGALKEMFRRAELSYRNGGYLAVPVLSGAYLYGVLLIALTDDYYDRGEMIAGEIGRALYLNRDQDGGGSGQRIFADGAPVYRRASDRDPVLNMLNKKAITEYAESVCRTGNPVAYIAILDLDRFKLANAILGNDFGDSVLSGMTDIINRAVGVRGVIGRIGGDEVMLITKGIEDPEEIRSILRRIRQKIEEKYRNVSESVSITCSIGCAAFPKDGENFASVMEKADLMLNLSREKGGNRFEIMV
ncbi:MAG: GGDEF domain-containing protein [Lachnospiraceae bacterium]|nr:GGDEF domain-containing protein [Lachnospiraceae bacterium]